MQVSDYVSNLPVQYQYYPGLPKRGGGDRHGAPSNDYCPMVMQTYGERLCSDSHSTSEQWDLGMRPGSSSLCFQSTLRRNAGSTASRGAGCYAAACLPDGTMQVTITTAGGGSSSAVCARYGQVLTWTGYSGSVACPDVQGICAPGPKGAS